MLLTPMNFLSFLGAQIGHTLSSTTALPCIMIQLYASLSTHHKCSSQEGKYINYQMWKCLLEYLKIWERGKQGKKMEAGAAKISARHT